MSTKRQEVQQLIATAQDHITPAAQEAAALPNWDGRATHHLLKAAELLTTAAKFLTAEEDTDRYTLTYIREKVAKAIREISYALEEQA